MKMKGNALAIAAVSGLAFALGHVHGLAGGRAGAWGQEQKPEAPDTRMQSYDQAGAPDEHHKYLDALAGNWTGVFKIWIGPDAAPFTSQGTVTRQWILGGRFLRETVKARSDWGTFEALAFLGYNKMDGQYEFVWMEDMSTAMYFETGHFDPDRKVLRTRGSTRDPITGRLTSTRGELDVSDPDRHVYNGYSIGPDGREYKSFEGTAIRIVE